MKIGWDWAICAKKVGHFHPPVTKLMVKPHIRHHRIEFESFNFFLCITTIPQYHRPHQVDAIQIGDEAPPLSSSGWPLWSIFIFPHQSLHMSRWSTGNLVHPRCHCEGKSDQNNINGLGEFISPPPSSPPFQLFSPSRHYNHLRSHSQTSIPEVISTQPSLYPHQTAP